MKSDSPSRLPILAVLLAATLAGSAGVFIHYIEIPATSISFIRSVIPAVLAGIWMKWKGIAFFRGNYRVMLIASGLNAIRLFFFFSAYQLTSIGNAVTISYTWPIFVSLGSAWVLKETISVRNRWLMLLAFIGVGVVYANQEFSFENQDFLGMLAALGVAITYACVLVIFKKESNTYRPFETIFYQNLLGIAVFLPFFWFNEPAPTPLDWSLSVGFSVLLGVIAFSFFFYGLSKLKASTASNLAYIEIVSAFLLGTFWLGQELTWNMLLGEAIIMGTTFWLRKE
ncbi:MAG: EamA family transporter [Bacteroidota bacterium]